MPSRRQLLAQLQSLKIKRIGPVIEGRLHQAGIYSRLDAMRYIQENGCCKLLEVLGVGPKRGMRIMRSIGITGCYRCNKALEVRMLDRGYRSVVEGKRCANLMPVVQVQRTREVQERYARAWTGAKVKPEEHDKKLHEVVQSMERAKARPSEVPKPIPVQPVPPSVVNAPSVMQYDLLDHRKAREAIVRSAEEEAGAQIKAEDEDRVQRAELPSVNEANYHSWYMSGYTNDFERYRKEAGYFALKRQLEGKDGVPEIEANFEKWKRSRLSTIDSNLSEYQRSIKEFSGKADEDRAKAQRWLDEMRRIRALPEEERKRYYGGEFFTKDGKERDKIQREIRQLQSSSYVSNLNLARENSGKAQEEKAELEKTTISRGMVEKWLKDAKSTQAESVRKVREEAQSKVEQKLKQLEENRNFIKKAVDAPFKGVIEPKHGMPMKAWVETNENGYVLHYTNAYPKKEMEFYADSYDGLKDVIERLMRVEREDVRADVPEGRGRLPEINWTDAARNKLTADLATEALGYERRVGAGKEEPTAADEYILKTASGRVGEIGEGTKATKSGITFPEARLIERSIGSGPYRVENGAIQVKRMDPQHISIVDAELKVPTDVKSGKYYIRKGELEQAEKGDEERVEEAKVPHIDFGVDATLTTKGLRDTLKDISAVSDQVRFSAAKKEIRLAGKSDAGASGVSFTPDSADLLSYDIKGEENQATYSTEYLLGFLSNLPKSYETVRMEFGHKKPMKLVAKNDEGNELTYMIAPRVQD